MWHTYIQEMRTHIALTLADYHFTRLIPNTMEEGLGNFTM